MSLIDSSLSSRYEVPRKLGTARQIRRNINVGNADITAKSWLKRLHALDGLGAYIVIMEDIARCEIGAFTVFCTNQVLPTPSIVGTCEEDAIYRHWRDATKEPSYAQSDSAASLPG